VKNTAEEAPVSAEIIERPLRVFRTVYQGRSAVPYSADDFGRSGLRPLRDAVFFKAGARGLHWGLLGERGSADDAAPARHVVVSSEAERSRDTPMNRADTTGTATSVEVSPLCPDSGRDCGRDDVFSGGYASPAHPGSCRAERSAVETPP
jgi:hypothetical protein